MTKKRLTQRLGIGLVLAHLTLILFVLFSPLLAGVLMTDALSLLTVVVPLFAAFTTMIVRHAIRTAEETEDQSPDVSSYFTFLVGFTASVFGVSVWGITLGYIFDLIPISLETAKIALAAVETAVGVFVGYFVEDLFAEENPTETDQARHQE